MQPLQAELPVTLAPFADGHPRQPNPPGNGGVSFAGPAGQHELGPLHDRMRQLSTTGKSLELLNLILTENQRRHR
jgi:hypothetical protein